MKNKNILELCLAHGLGGLELFVASCYESFSQKGTCKVVVAPKSKLDNYLDNIDKFHIKRSKIFPIAPAMKLAKYIDENEIDIVHFHWTKDIITAVLAKLLSKRKPKLVQSRHMRMTRFKDDVYHKWLYKNIDMIHAVTLRVKEQLEEFIPQEIRPKIEMVYLGVKALPIEQEKIRNLKKQYALGDEFIVGIVGRIEEGKGQYKVIDALSILGDLKIKVFIVGSAMDESYLTNLKQKISLLGLDEKVIFTGFTKNVDEYMQLFDVNILATENETFGLVVIEAMINNIAMIATAKGGPLEIIEENVDGLLFDGSIKDLADKIELLYKNRALKSQISNAGFLKAKEKFDWSGQLDKLYRAMT
jgi:glycosyltransferase involved in cell wall biosynthesis